MMEWSMPCWMMGVMFMADPSRFTEAELLNLASRGVHKVDQMGERGATLCTQNEIIAMAAVLKLTFAGPLLVAENTQKGQSND